MNHEQTAKELLEAVKLCVPLIEALQRQLGQNFADEELAQARTAIANAESRATAPTGLPESTNRWYLYRSDDAQSSIGEVQAPTYEEAVNAALAELGYFVSEDGPESETV